MSIQDRGISPNPFDGDFQPGKTIELKRADFSNPDAFAEIADMPPKFVSALRGLAREAAVTGLAAIVEDDEIDLRVIQNIPKDPVARAKISLLGMNLQLLGMGSTWIDMKGRPFEEIEADIKQEVSGNPKAILAGIFRFTD